MRKGLSPGFVEVPREGRTCAGQRPHGLSPGRKSGELHWMARLSGIWAPFPPTKNAVGIFSKTFQNRSMSS